MQTSVETLHSADGGSFDAHVAYPDALKAPGLVLLQYICGVNRGMRELAQGFARAGYLVAVPDLFWRQAPHIELIDNPAEPDPAEQQRALSLNDAFQDETAVLDMKAALDFLRGHSRCTGRVGALGYCLGGRLSVLLALRADIDCAVSYYGVNLDRYLDQVGALTAPLLMHMAEKDVLVPPSTREKIVSALGVQPRVRIEVHPGVNHAFALEGGANYSPEAARRADADSEAFLKRHLFIDAVPGEAR